MRWNRSNFARCVLFLGIFGCQGKTLDIKANVDADILQVDQGDGTPRSIGTLPKSITLQKGMDTLVIRKDGFKPIRVVMPITDGLAGELVLTLRPGVESSDEQSMKEDRVLDRLLAAHRSFLRGQLGEAKTQLDAIENDAGGVFYGLLMLRANIAYVEKNYQSASQDYARARSLLPDREEP